MHGLGAANDLVDQLSTYEQISLDAEPRRAATVHKLLADAPLMGNRRSTATGLPYGNAAWVTELAAKLYLDLTIRPRGRPPKRSLSERGHAGSSSDRLTRYPPSRFQRNPAPRLSFLVGGGQWA